LTKELRNLLSTVPKGAQDAVAAFVPTIFAQPDHTAALAQLKEVSTTLRPRFHQATTLLDDAGEDVLSHLHFPPDHRRRLIPQHTLNITSGYRRT
jgi:putative transposase